MTRRKGPKAVLMPRGEIRSLEALPLMILLLLSTLLVPSLLIAQETAVETDVELPPSPLPPEDLVVTDTPNDDGSSLTLSWTLPPGSEDAEITVWRTVAGRDELTEVAELPAGTTSHEDTGLDRHESYQYLLRAERDTLWTETALSAPVSPHLNWYARHRTNALILFVIFCALVLGFIATARSGRELFIRRIAGLNALDEAIGRATEMGRKILYVPGIMSLDEIQTVASMAVLKHVAKSTAAYQAELEVLNKDPIAFSAMRETVKEAYTEAGRPDLYREDMVQYVTYDQFAFTSSVTGKMVRERPAANLLIGSFYAESLLLAETGQGVGAIQIAGTAEVAQLPFFVCACDYTLIGEELYAASAYLSRDPVMLGSIKGQDYTKLLVMIVIVVGIILESIHIHVLSNFLIHR